MSLIGLLSLVSVATLTTFNRSVTDIQILQAEKNITHAFVAAENRLMVAEESLLAGALRNDLVQIEAFHPKGFRKRPNTETTHYKLTASEYRHQTKIEIETIVRIHETSPPSKTSRIKKSSDRTLERISWRII